MPTYAIKGNSQTEQAEISSENPAASNVQMRILVELQLLTFLLADANASDYDLQELRQSFADSIT